MPAATFTGTEDQDTTGQLQATDSNGDTVTFTVSTAPARGSMVAFSPTGAFTYRPNANVFGNDSFVVTASDGRGGTVNATITLSIAGVDDPLVASNDRIEIPYAVTLNIDVLANDGNLDNDASISVTEPALVGAATVNADNTVSITALPANFRGLTRFRYRLTDSTGATSDAVANVFVGMAPFRAVVRTPLADPQSFGIGITDFTGAPRRLNVNEPAPSGASTVSMRASTNGEVVAYHRLVTSATFDSGQICSVRTAAGSTPQCFAIPGDRRLGTAHPSSSTFVYSISPNGRWVAAVLVRADLGFAASLYVIDTQSPTLGTLISVAGAEHAVQPTFTSDSRYLYFTGTATLDNDGRGIYRVQLGAAQPPLRMTRVEDPASIVDSFALSPDGSRMVFQRNGLDAGVWLVDTAVPGQEQRLSHAFAVDEQLQRQQALPMFVNAALTSVAYIVWHPDNSRTTWMADVSSANPAPRAVATVAGNATSINPSVRADGEAIVYTSGTSLSANNVMVYEALKSGGSPRLVTRGFWAGYAGGGDYFLSLDLFWNAPTFNFTSHYTVLARSVLGGSVTVAGTPGLQSRNAAGDLDRPVLLMNQSADGFGAQLVGLVNYAAPNNVLPLIDGAVLVPQSEGPSGYLIDGE